MSQDCIDSAAVCNPEEFPCSLSRKRHMCREEDRMETFRNSWCDQKRPTAQEMVNSVFTIKNMVIVFAVFIVEVDYFNGKPTTTLDTSMQNGFLCVNTY